MFSFICWSCAFSSKQVVLCTLKESLGQWVHQYNVQSCPDKKFKKVDLIESHLSPVTNLIKHFVNYDSRVVNISNLVVITT